jgi:transposase
MGKKPAPALIISERRLNLLRNHIAKRTTSVSDFNRVSILLLSAQGYSNAELARQLKIDYGTVCRWRKRWLVFSEYLDKFEKGVNEVGVSDTSLLTEMLSGLKDTSRPGKPPVITDYQKDQIVALACQKPSEHDLPFTHWTQDLLAQTSIKIGIVPNVSGATVWRILKKKNFSLTKMFTGYIPK